MNGLNIKKLELICIRAKKYAYEREKGVRERERRGSEEETLILLFKLANRVHKNPCYTCVPEALRVSSESCCSELKQLTALTNPLRVGTRYIEPPSHNTTERL